MNKDIENIIKKNLPEKKGHDSIVQLGVYDQATTEGKLHYQNEYGKRDGFNQALSQINTALITDEVLKVVVETGEEEIKRINDIIPKQNDYEQGYIRGIKEYIQLLSTISPNKENKNNG